MLVRTDAPLGPLTTLGIGGTARRLVTVHDEAELVAAVRAADDVGEPLLLLGGGSNVVLQDEPVEGTVVRIATQGLRVRADGDGVLVEAAAGQDWDRLVQLCVEDGLAGVECLSGIPGLVGGTPVQNVGAYGQDVAETVVRVRCYDRDAADVVELDAADCGFGYRTSRFKHVPRWVVLAVTYRLAPGAQSAPVRYAELARALAVEPGQTAPLEAVRGAVLALRRGKGMVLDPADPDSRSAGSFFTNPVLSDGQLDALRLRAAPREVPVHPGGKVSAAWLIEQAGFTRGWGAGPVGLSTKHALALVNRGGATSADLRHAARQVRDGVREALGVELVPEPVLIGGPL